MAQDPHPNPPRRHRTRCRPLKGSQIRATPEFGGRGRESAPCEPRVFPPPERGRDREGVPGETLADLDVEGAKALRAAGIDSPRHEARVLLAEASGLSRDELIADPARIVSSDIAGRFREFIRRRSEREPIAYILGRREFWSLKFKVSPAVLIPRPDSETLIEAALTTISDRRAPLRLLDLGTGSGCLLLALLSELPQASGVGLDISAEALAMARENAEALGLSGRAAFLEGGWNETPPGPFDIVLANPPYISEPDLHRLERDVRDYEPHRALSGGKDGLDAYRPVVAAVARVLAPGGAALIELGAGQAGPVSAFAEEQGFYAISRAKDLAGHERCLILRGPRQKNLLE
jgi:release factor glutamine methyltransferase